MLGRQVAESEERPTLEVEVPGSKPACLFVWFLNVVVNN